MERIINSIKEYFKKKEKGQQENEIPDLVCPTCWGYNEWDGEFYDVIKDKHLIPSNDNYSSFISKVVDKHISTTHKHEDKYICLTCNKEI